jgi:hypothetical protein
LVIAQDHKTAFWDRFGHNQMRSFGTQLIVEYRAWMDAVAVVITPEDQSLAVREWIATWNADSRPFACTKTAEEILATLHEHISRISGAGH